MIFAWLFCFNYASLSYVLKLTVVMLNSIIKKIKNHHFHD